ncbi:Hypothetical predicted protein [Olea europaea subsp. europaea]|uniref:Uncharacterized protein n=1 Tax=Olea europaea subsp. europaea TaxID=158383 RepID=A0A8S0PBE9_OLEEU|nr:Hypothetical predicted protein [Olea europaea subsp. europaea]
MTASRPVKNASLRDENAHGDWTTVIGFLIAVCAIVTATFSTGIDSQTFQIRKDEVHWNLETSTRKWSIDVGRASTWVKIVNERFAATIYRKFKTLPLLNHLIQNVKTDDLVSRDLDD